MPKTKLILRKYKFLLISIFVILLILIIVNKDKLFSENFQADTSTDFPELVLEKDSLEWGEYLELNDDGNSWKVKQYAFARYENQGGRKPPSYSNYRSTLLQEIANILNPFSVSKSTPTPLSNKIKKFMEDNGKTRVNDIDEEELSTLLVPNFTKIYMPDTYENKPITEIDMYAFCHFNSLACIILSNNITSIGLGSFMNCEFEKVSFLPNSLTEIKYRAFYDCNNLREVIIPKNVETINRESFYQTNLDKCTFSWDEQGDNKIFNNGRLSRIFSSVREIVIPFKNLEPLIKLGNGIQEFAANPNSKFKISIITVICKTDVEKDNAELQIDESNLFRESQIVGDKESTGIILDEKQKVFSINSDENLNAIKNKLICSGIDVNSITQSGGEHFQNLDAGNGLTITSSNQNLTQEIIEAVSGQNARVVEIKDEPKTPVASPTEVETGGSSGTNTVMIVGGIVSLFLVIAFIKRKAIMKMLK